MNYRKQITYVPYISSNIREVPYMPTSQWPCNWISCKTNNGTPCVTAYRLFFTLDKADAIMVHVSADERYELYIDGIMAGRGSERGDSNNWYYETYELMLEEGTHSIVARTWSLGGFRPDAQISVYPGFILSPEDDRYIDVMGTGIACWEVKELTGYEFHDCSVGTTASGANIIVDGVGFPWGYEKWDGDGWELPLVREKGNNEAHMYHIIDGTRYMKPGTLKPMYVQTIDKGKTVFAEKLHSLDTDIIPVESKNNMVTESLDWTRVANGSPVVIQPFTKIRAIIDLENYYCAYPEITTSGGKGSYIRIKWAEALFDNLNKDSNDKSNRNIIENKFIRGKWDAFKPDGGERRVFNTLWWNSGRYIEIAVETDNEPLIIEKFTILETRYPLYMQSSYSCSDYRMKNALDKCFRTLQMCAHETYMDCPYYEQVMYVGDTRLQVLATYVCTTDSQLPKKCLLLYSASSLNHTGMVNCAYPAYNQKIIPSFCLWWVCMVYDYALWRGEKDFIKSLMPIVRNQIDIFFSGLNKDGLIETPKGWNFFDWANEGENIFYENKDYWSYGEPNDEGTRVNSLLNWQMVLTLTKVAELEEYIGEIELANRAKRRASELVSNIIDKFWDKNKCMFSDDLDHNYFSQHAQCLAILTGLLDTEYSCKTENALLTSSNLSKTSIYFKHYLFEVLCSINQIDKLLEEMQVWYKLDELGLNTTPEVFSTITRSDCHAWGAHPLYHYFTSILGIRPRSMGFESVVIRPQLGTLSSAEGVMAHPKGDISVTFNRKSDILKTKIILPENLKGTLIVGGSEMELVPGSQEFEIKMEKTYYE